MQAPAIIHRLFRKDYQAVDPNRNGGWHRILEPFTGAWQRNISIDRDSVLAYHAVYACITLIAQDIGKLRPKLMQQQASGIWKEKRSDSPFLPVLRKPNHYQTRIKFQERWISSKLINGNAYILKERDNRNVVTAMYVLDPCRVRVLIADDQSVFYELNTSRLHGLPESIIVPADEIIHDPMVTLFNDLVGVSPLFACGLGAQQGVNIQKNSSLFFGNMSRPGGILTAPGHIEDDTARRAKEQWEERFGGDNVGRTAVLGDGLEWKPTAINAEDSQMIEQLKWTAEMVCSCFHVPPFMIGVGSWPAFQNIEAAYTAYYSQCLQSLIESMELSLDEGLGLVSPNDSLGVELDLKGLLRMDTAGRYDAHTKGIQGGWLKPNEARAEEDMDGVTGGDTPYMQQQNFSLSELNIRREQTEARAADAGDDAATDVQATAMNGAQVTALQGLIVAVANGEIPPQSAAAALAAAFPLLDKNDIDAMINPLLNFTPKPEEPATPEPEPEPTADPPTPPADDDEEEEDSEADERALEAMAAAEFDHEEE